MALTRIHPPHARFAGRESRWGDCKIDEHGHAVHEECYVARMKLEAKSKQQPVFQDTGGAQ